LLTNTVKNAIIIFVRNPVSGKVKTRLAKTIGDDKALLIYQLLLEHTRQVTGNLHCDKFVYYSDHIDENDDWKNSLYKKRLQSAGDLGERMANAFETLFTSGYQRLVIIGSDCLDLNSDLINEAFNRLSEVNVVFGPSTDGGYYLLGLKVPYPPGLFENKSWSTDTVLPDSLKTLEATGTSYQLLIPLNDIDEESDLPASLLKRVN
jgi:uncharacterized protein